jgi:hypothetical protein
LDGTYFSFAIIVIEAGMHLGIELRSSRDAEVATYGLQYSWPMVRGMKSLRLEFCGAKGQRHEQQPDQHLSVQEKAHIAPTLRVCGIIRRLLFMHAYELSSS